MRIYISILFSFMLLLLPACADTEWPQWLSGEPTREELDAYKGPIPMPNPDSEGKTWPNLADVPNRPKVILQEDKKDILVTEMKDKNIEGLHEIEEYNKGLKPAVTSPVKKPAAKIIKKTKHKKKKKVRRHAK